MTSPRKWSIFDPPPPCHDLSLIQLTPSPQPTCRGPYAWLQHPYNLLIELARKFGAMSQLLEKFS